MTALAAAANRQSMGGVGSFLDFPVEASVTIYKGGLVGINAAGYAIPMDNAATTIQCLGVADETVVGTTQGAKSVRVSAGRIWLFAASSITQAMVGDEMLAIDDNTVDETSTNGATIGRLVKYVSTTSGWVFVPGFLAHPLSI
jgi:hypothetical protein